MAFVQSRSQRVASGANALAFLSNVGTGALIVVSIELETVTATITSVAGGSLTWTAIGSLQSQSGNAAGQLYYAKNASAGALTVTVTPSAGASHISIEEWSGMDTTAPLDVQAQAQGSGTAANSGAAVTTVANDVILGCVLGNRHPVQEASFTSREDVSFNTFMNTFDKVGVSAGSYNALATLSGGGELWIALLACFKPVAGGGGVTPGARMQRGLGV